MFAFLFITIADDVEWPRLQAFRLAPMHQRVFLTVRHPHFRSARSSNSCGETVPVGVVGNHKWYRDAPLACSRAHAHPARRESRNRIRKTPRPQVADATGWADDDASGKLRCIDSAHQLNLSELNAATLVITRGRFNGAMDVNRPIVPG